MEDITVFLSYKSAAITALATVVIAIFSFLTWFVSKRIHSRSYEKILKEIVKDLSNNILLFFNKLNRRKQRGIYHRELLKIGPGGGK